MNITPFPTLSPATIDAINVIGQWLAQDDFSGEVPYQADCVILAGNAVMPTIDAAPLIEPHYPKGEGGRPAYPLMAMLRVHLLQNWFGYSDPAMEEALYETTILRQFAGLNLERIPDETTILNFRRLLEKHELAAGILAVINGSGRPRPVAAPGHHRRCNADQCAQFDQEQGRQARPGNAPDQEGKPVLFRQCDLKVAWVSVPQVNARRNRLFHHSFPTQTGVAGNSRV